MTEAKRITCQIKLPSNFVCFEASGVAAAWRKGGGRQVVASRRCVQDLKILDLGRHHEVLAPRILAHESSNS
jgi:hypothetical protein